MFVKHLYLVQAFVFIPGNNENSKSPSGFQIKFRSVLVIQSISLNHWYKYKNYRKFSHFQAEKRSTKFLQMTKVGQKLEKSSDTLERDVAI